MRLSHSTEQETKIRTMMGLHVVLLFAIISGVEMFSLGAPDSACKSDMHPKHGDGVSVQKGPSPYTLTISQIDYRPKENIIGKVQDIKAIVCCHM